MTSRFRSLAVPAALALLAACSSSSGALRRAGQPPASFNGFPSQAVSDIVIAEAKLYTNHADLFEGDLLGEGILPVALKIGLRGQGQDEAQVRISPDDMDLRLYLPDGTALNPVPYARVASDDEDMAKEVTRRALKPTWLVNWDATQEGFLFFALKPERDFKVQRDRVLHDQNGVERVLDLSKSLLAFKVTRADRLEPFFVGVQPDVKSGR
jgi:hypothetical protein